MDLYSWWPCQFALACAVFRILHSSNSFARYYTLDSEHGYTGNSVASLSLWQASKSLSCAGSQPRQTLPRTSKGKYVLYRSAHTLQQHSVTTVCAGVTSGRERLQVVLISAPVPIQTPALVAS